MAAGNEKQDEFERLFGRSESSAEAGQPGTFTRAFFASEPVKSPPPVEVSSANSGVESPPITPLAPPTAPGPASTPSSSAPGEFTRIFGGLNVEATPKPPKPPEERAYPGIQNAIPSSEPATLTDLFAQRSPNPVQPVKPEADTFSKFFHPEVSPERGQSSPSEFTQLFKNSGPGFTPPVNTDPLARSQAFPPIDDPHVEKPVHDMGTGPSPFAEANKGRDPKATRLFSFEQPSVASVAAPVGGPSAFTRIINSSAQRSASEKEPAAPVANHPPAQAPPAGGSPAPIAVPQWSASMPPAPQAPAFPQQPQMSMPAVPPVAWPQPPAPPAVAPPSVQPPQVQPEQQPPQPAWVAYLPLIIGFNVLFFLTAIIILIFALNR